MSTRPEMPPHEMQMEWLRFIADEPTVAELDAWCTLKAAEIRWDVLDLVEALSLGVAQPKFRVAAKPTTDRGRAN